jgi:hypothetical protein
MKLKSNWMQQTLCEADIRSASQEIPQVLTEVDGWGTDFRLLFPLQRKSDTR